MRAHRDHGRRVPRKGRLLTLHDNQGLTLLETIVVAVITALLAGAVASTAHLIFSTDQDAESTMRATDLGLGLLREIAALPFDDPQDGESSLGPETGEWTGTSRLRFDDVDDYTVWTGELTLQTKGGTALAIGGYSRQVQVAYVTPGDFDVVSVTATDYKRITVEVYEGSALIETFVTVRVQGGRNVDLGE